VPTLTAAQGQERLCTAVESATEARFEPDEKAAISADLVRRLALNLALEGEDAARKLTPFGIRIIGAEIRERLDLDNATPSDGGPLAPLEFHDCTLSGGFSGAHARFSRLSFRKCSFGDPPPDEDGCPRPSLNLAGASIGTDLGLRGVKPASATSHLWIRAAGAWIDGEVDLSRSVLKAPQAWASQLVSEPSPDALDLSLAEVRGDFQFMNGGSCSGRINMRGAHITGDVWISAVSLDGAGKECLFLQSTTIGGNLVLDGRPARYDETGGIERLTAVGEIHLLEIKLSGSLNINNMDLQPTPAEAHARPSDDGVCVCLEGARIGGPVSIGAIEPHRPGPNPTAKSTINGRLVLDGMEVTSSIKLKDAQIGLKTEDLDSPATISARSLVAKRVEIRGIEPLLWSEEDKEKPNPKPQMLSVDLAGARIERLKIRTSRFSGYLRARPLICARDVTLDVWVGAEVDLKGSDVGGSLDISDLRADRGLFLRDASIGRALKFKRPPAPDGRLEDLIKARITELTCLPETSLIETLWRYRSGSNVSRVCQVAFLRKRRLIRPLDKPEALEIFVATQGHAVDSPGAAEEYVRLMAAYAGKPEDRAWVVPDPAQLPPFVEFDQAVPGPAAPGVAETPADAIAAEAAPAEVAASAAQPEAAAAHAADSAKGAALIAADASADVNPPASVKDLPAEQFALRPRTEGGKFVVRGCFLHDKHLVRTTFRVMPAHRRVTVDTSFGKLVSPPLRNVPQARELYTYHPTVEQQPAGEQKSLDETNPVAEQKPDEDWVIPPVLKGGQDEKRPAGLQKQLLPYVQPGSSIRGEVDLTDLSCDTLDDGGGRFWGKKLKFRLDRFVYRQATWVNDPPDSGFRNWVRRHVNRLIAERAWPGLIDRFGWKETRLQGEDFWAPWQIRRNWIYQQFRLEPDLSSPTRHRIEQSEYRPQPFEQAIRVARNEGREDFAANFEILKRRIEWSLFSRRSRRLLLMIGIAAALAWLLLRGGPHFVTVAAMASLILLVLIGTRPRSDKYPFSAWLARALLAATVAAGTTAWLAWRDAESWERARDFAIAILILVGLRYISTVSDWLMRNLFGYLRLPINAIVSLIAAFLLGWAAVDVANDRGMLVIDVEPVASVVMRSASDRRVYVGTPRGGPGVHNVACGTEIDEPLYALDVLIPLIDFRQENRCEVGRAIPFDADETNERKPVAYLVELLLGPILDSEGFWSAAKALYAIAGWFLVSLSILTFANANRPRGEPGG